MPYIKQDLKTLAFISGQTALYTELQINEQLVRVPINRLDTIRGSLKQLGYNFRVRYRGPHRPQHDTLKQNARAFSVYIIE